MAGDDALLTMGQWLSIPVVAIGVDLKRALTAYIEHRREVMRSAAERQMRGALRAEAPQLDQVLALEIPGVSVQREYRRYYPASEVAGHLVGFTNIDDQGQEGLELAFNHWLAGESGAKRVLKDRLGRSIENVASIRPPRHGKDLRTSIDLRLQYLAYRTLKSAIKTHNARSGSIVVLDVKTGEVLAMVNQPTYNPNDRSQLYPERYRNRNTMLPRRNGTRL